MFLSAMLLRSLSDALRQWAIDKKPRARNVLNTAADPRCGNRRFLKVLRSSLLLSSKRRKKGVVEFWVFGEGLVFEKVKDLE